MKGSSHWESVFIAFVFILSTSFFIYQHTTGLSWDFSVYVLNTKYIFSDGKYFEWLRPPLAPIILGLFSFLGWKFSEYLFIIFSSALFLFSSIKFSKKFNLPSFLYYTFVLNFFVLVYSFSSGTELLTLSFLHFFIISLETYNWGIFFALSFLTRYSSVVYFPLIFIKRDWKKILIGSLIFMLLVSPWLIYNFIKTGDPFTSFADFYLMNVILRQDSREKISIKDFLIVGNILIPFIFIGSIDFFKNKDENFWKISLFFLMCLFSYLFGAFKSQRYLFNLSLVFAYLSSLGMKNFDKKISLMPLFIFSLGFILALFYFEPLEKPEIYEDLSKKLEICETRSNGWVFLNYFGFQSGPIPWRHQVEKMVESGARFVVFKKINDPDFGDFWERFPKIDETEEYIVVGNSSFCLPPKSFEMIYFNLFSEACGVDVSKYSIIFPKKNLCENIKYCEEFKNHFC